MLFETLLILGGAAAAVQKAKPKPSLQPTLRAQGKAKKGKK